MSWVGLTILALYVLSVPWYRASGAEPTLVFGVPDWVAVAVACYVAIATIAAITWLRVRFEDLDGDGKDSADP